MNGRIYDEGNAPEEILAAVAKGVTMRLLTVKPPILPDEADFRDAFRLPMKRQELLWRIDEARKVSGELLTARMKVLGLELRQVEQEMGI